MTSIPDYTPGKITGFLAPPVGVAALGARVEVPVTREIVSAYKMATLTDGLWVVAVDPPVAAGDYLFVWRTPDADPPDFEFLEAFTYGPSATVGDGEIVDSEDWKPTLGRVAALVPEYTRHDIDDDGAPQFTFDDDTDPTVGEVNGYIEAAVGEVADRVGVPIRAFCSDLATRAAAWHAAASIEAKQAAGGTDDASSAFAWKQATYVATLNELVAQARNGQNTALRIS